jgi:hypothetical protein
LLNNANPQDEKGTFEGYAQRQYITADAHALMGEAKSTDRKNGDKKKTQELAHKESMTDDFTFGQKLVEFEKKYPSRGPGKKRALATIDHVSSRSSTYSDTKGRWMDLLQFASHMQRDRQWTFGQAKTRWDLDLLNNTNPQDEKGTFAKSGYAQRQYIIIGEFGGAVAENYEDKNLTMEAKKMKKMTTEKMAEAVEALNQGHSNFLEPHLACAAASASHAAGVRNPLAQSVETPVLLSQSDVICSSGVCPTC